jgi:tripeptide aminopeptidase
LGIIQGGDATNVVTDLVRIQGECRSYDLRMREMVVRRITQAFRRAAATVRNDKRQRGRVEIASEVEYEAFRLTPGEPCIQVAQAAIRSIGLEPELLTSNSALDANWMNFHGIPTATLGSGQVFGHSVRECLDVEQFEQACRIALRLASGVC